MVTLAFFMGILPGSTTGETARLTHIPLPAPHSQDFFKILVLLVGDVVLHCEMGS